MSHTRCVPVKWSHPSKAAFEDRMRRSGANKAVPSQTHKRGRRMQPVLFIEQPAIRRCWWWFDLFFSKDNYGGNSSWICFWMQVRGFKSLKHPTVQCWQKQRTPILSWLLDNRSSVSCLKGRAEESWWCRFPTDWTISSNNARFSLLTVWRPRIHRLHPSKDAAN